ncbi:MAG: hypothetical protein SPF87_03220 [Bacilli bacterium]|nr:hypothetical protein [Bacilli bacterium]
MKNILTKICPFIFISSLLISCHNDVTNASFLPDVGEVRLLFKHSENETVGDDGEDYFYNYCPSIFIENNTQYVYYCTNKDWGNVTDYIGYREGNINKDKIEYSQENIVISPTDNTWDETHTCDPTVIKGSFEYNDESYSYLMAYLGCVPSDCTLNETGIAVSKSPSGPWIKCNGNKVDGSSINPIVPYTDFSYNDKTWGTGQACLQSIDKAGNVLLITTVSSLGGSDVREYDFSNINDYKLKRETKLFTNGITYGSNWIGNSEIVLDETNKKFILAKPRGPFGSDGEYPNFIADTIDVYYVDASSYENPFDIFFDKDRISSWIYVNSINKELSGYPRNHNCGIISDEYGRLYGDKQVGVAFTSSQYGSISAMSYLKTYRIFATTFDLPY